MVGRQKKYRKQVGKVMKIRHYHELYEESLKELLFARNSIRQMERSYCIHPLYSCRGLGAGVIWCDQCRTLLPTSMN